MEKKQFKAESKRLLDLMINSIYTNREIFLRELLSNASDAMDKLAYTALTQEKTTLDRESLTVTLIRDAQARTLTVSDCGIGMSREELEENLGTIAKSGSLSFKQAMEKSEDVDIIGQFGVGFYAAFMVADSITVTSRKYGSQDAWRWSSDGADGYTVEEASRESVGTDIVLHLKDDTEEEKFSQFLEEYTLRSLVRKYSDYLRYPIRMEVTKSRKKEDSDDYESYTEMETLNSMVPLWQRAKKDVTEEEYAAFYREKFMDWEKPLRTVHFSAEGTVSFKALLYIPAKAPYGFYTQDFKPGLQLYSSGVMIMEHCEDLLPEHLRFVRGVVDSQDLSLNISRELLQHDRQLTLMAKNIARKVKGELTAMLENSREDYEKFYAAFSRSLKYGTVAEYGAHKDQTQDLLLFMSQKEQKLITLKEYVDAMAEGQEKIYYAPGADAARAAQLPQVRTLQSRGYDVLLMGDEVDEFIPQTLGTYGEKEFCNAATEDLGLHSQEEKKALEDRAEALKGFLDFVKETLGEQVAQVRLSADLGDIPAAMVPQEGMSFEMEKYMKRMNPEMAMSLGRILELNPDHAAVENTLKAMTAQPEKARTYVKLLCAQAMLLADLPLPNPSEYTALVCGLMQ